MSRTRSFGGVVDLLRLLVVVFFAGVGYEVGERLDKGAEILGPFTAVAIGVIVGSGLGYVLGGVIGRSAVAAVGRTEVALRKVSAEQLVAGWIGGVLGLLVGVGAAWPLFFIGEPFISFPLFGVVVVVLCLLGYRLGAGRRDDMLHIFGARAGLAARPNPVSTLPRLVDTSVAVDGRVLDVVRAGFLHGKMLVPAPVLAELQGMADAADETRRAKGRRGLEILEVLRREPGVVVEVLDDEVPQVPEVDAKLVRLCVDRGFALLTLDTSLARVAALAGVQVLNFHALTLALRPVVAAGDEITVLLIKVGKEPGQAVGYLDDGTMVVAEHSRARVGHDATVRVTSVLTTANGRMVFGQPAGSQPVPARPGVPARRVESP